MSLIKKICILCVTAALVLSGCSGGDTTWVYESGGARMPAGQYIIYLMDATAEAQYKAMEGHENEPDYEFPTQKEILKSTIEGMPGSQWIENKAAGYVKEYYAIESEFARLGLRLTPENEAQVKASVNNIWGSYGSFYETNGVSQASLSQQQASMLKKDLIFEALYSPEGERAVSEDELKDIFAGKYASADYLVFYLPDTQAEGEPTVEEQVAQIRAMSEDFRARLEAGEAAEELYYEYDLSKAPEEDKDNIVKMDPGTLSLIVNADEASVYEEGFVDMIMDCPVGKAVINEKDDRIFVVKRKELSRDDEIFENYRQTLLSDLKAEEFEQRLLQDGEAIRLVENPAALKRYKASWIKE